VIKLITVFSRPAGEERDILFLFVLVALVVALDQLSKYLVATYMEAGESIAVIKDFFHLTYVRNPGAAFGMLPYRTVLLVVITLLVIGLIIYYYRTLPPGFWLMKAGLALQLGGAIGNMIDRVRSSYVIDFLDFKIWLPFSTWPTRPSWWELLSSCSLFGAWLLSWKAATVSGSTWQRKDRR